MGNGRLGQSIVRMIVVLVAVAAAWAGPAPRPAAGQAAPPVALSDVTFAFPNGGRLWLAPAGGAVREIVLPSPEFTAAPGLGVELSPDGARLAIRREVSGGAPTPVWETVVFDIAGGQVTPVATEPGRPPALRWADPLTLVLSGPCGSGCEAQQVYDLRLGPADPGWGVTITGAGADWSPDGRFVVVREPTLTPATVVYDRQGHEALRLAGSRPAPGYEAGPAARWSPDGHTLALLGREADGRTTLALYTAADGLAQAATTELRAGARGASLTWLGPDRLAYVGADYQARVFDLAAGTDEPLLTGRRVVGLAGAGGPVVALFEAPATSDEGDDPPLTIERIALVDAGGRLLAETASFKGVVGPSHRLGSDTRLLLPLQRAPLAAGVGVAALAPEGADLLYEVPAGNWLTPLAVTPDHYYFAAGPRAAGPGAVYATHWGDPSPALLLETDDVAAVAAVHG